MRRCGLAKAARRWIYKQEMRLSNQATTIQELHEMRKPHKRTIADAVAHKIAAQESAITGAQKAHSKRKAAGGRLAKPKPITARFVGRIAQPGEVVFVLPLPPKKLSPNGRGLYWMAKAKAVKTYRQACAALMQSAKQEPFTGRVVVDLEFYLCRVLDDTKSYYPNDEDNARGSMKAAQDALKDAGIILGDGKKFVRMGKTTLHTRAKEHQGFTCVVMTVRKDEEVK